MSRYISLAQKNANYYFAIPNLPSQFQFSSESAIRNLPSRLQRHAKEAWMDDVQRLSQVPEVFSDDPQEAKARSVALAEIRSCIAGRWNHIIDLKSSVPQSHFKILVERMKDSMTRLLEIHGSEIPFFCDPPDRLLSVEKGKDAILCEDGESVVSTTCPSSSGSSSTMLPHEFKFLRVGTGNDVWTDVQAGFGNGSRAC